MKNSVQQKIEEKQRELEELTKIESSTHLLAQQLEEIGQKLDVMNDGAESIALVLSNWKNVVNAVSLASLGLAKHAKNVSEKTVPLPETLVRIKLKEEKENPE